MKALITGASSGIGKDIAIALGDLGYSLVLVARDKKRLEEVKQEIVTQVLKKIRIETVILDLSKEENCKKLHEQVKNVDILVNNAGFGVSGKFVETDLDKEISMIKTNVIAVHILTKLYLQDMKKKDNGIILNTASIAGFMPGPLMASYYGTKAYVVRMSEAIREELKREKSKVQISILCPGPVKTNFNEVSGGKFNVHSLESKKVAEYAVRKMRKGKFVIVPGVLMKIVRVLVKITPNPIVSKFVYKVH